MVQFVETTVDLPMLMAVFGALSFSPSAAGSGLRHKSPRRHTPAMTTVLPPSIMFCLPSMLARREILLPVSYRLVRSGLTEHLKAVS